MTQTIYTYKIVIILNIFSVSFCSYIPRDEGSPCQHLGISGICKKVIHCDDALQEVKRDGQHSFLRCGFVGLSEVVCCTTVGNRIPDTHIPTWNPNRKWQFETSRNLRLKRKSDLMCQSYVKKYILGVIQPNINNGEDANQGQFPHMAALGYPSNSDPNIIDFQQCSGSLISLSFVLTAAHCLINVNQVLPVMVRLGVIDIRNKEEAQDINVKSSIPHPDYDNRLSRNDIALLELVKDVITNDLIYPACLYTLDDDPSKMIISGWGDTQSKEKNNLNGKGPTILQTATIKPVPIDKCNKTLYSVNKSSSRVIVDSHICAISKSDTCAGDSGGPLQIKQSNNSYSIVGVVSWGIQCGTKIPGVYTRVYSYLDWIENIIWSNQTVDNKSI